MNPFLPVLLLAAISLLGQDGEPRKIPLDLTFESDHVQAPPAGDPPTFSAAPVSRVLDPASGKPYDRSNEGLGCDPAGLRRTFRLESADVLLGEPILVEFRIEMDGEGRWREGWGGTPGAWAATGATSS